MNSRTYTVVASLAALLGLLVAIVPLLQSAGEYCSPDSVEPRPELASPEAGITCSSFAKRNTYCAAQSRYCET
jgi:hypothetical protein